MIPRVIDHDIQLLLCGSLHIKSIHAGEKQDFVVLQGSQEKDYHCEEWKASKPRKPRFDHSPINSSNVTN